LENDVRVLRDANMRNNRGSNNEKEDPKAAKKEKIILEALSNRN
jgi:hypothetical protein